MTRFPASRPTHNETIHNVVRIRPIMSYTEIFTIREHVINYQFSGHAFLLLEQLLTTQYWSQATHLRAVIIDSIHGQRNPHRERGLAGMGNGCFA